MCAQVLLVEYHSFCVHSDKASKKLKDLSASLILKKIAKTLSEVRIKVLQHLEKRLFIVINSSSEKEMGFKYGN